MQVGTSCAPRQIGMFNMNGYWIAVICAAVWFACITLALVTLSSVDSSGKALSDILVDGLSEKAQRVTVAALIFLAPATVVLLGVFLAGLTVWAIATPKSQAKYSRRSQSRRLRY